MKVEEGRWPEKKNQEKILKRFAGKVSECRFCSDLRRKAPGM